MRLIVFLLGVATALPVSALAQVAVAVNSKPRPAPPGPPQTTLRADASLVLVPVSVADQMNRPVTGLEKSHFRIFADKIEQQVSVFARDDEPVAVGLIFDTSGSMGRKLNMARRAAAEFFRVSNPEDEFFLLEFNDAPRLVVPLTGNTAIIQNELAFCRAGGRTALLDAVVLGLHKLHGAAQSRKALLIISDGGDNSSRYSERELRSRVQESDALIYAIGVYGEPGSPEENAGPELLTEIARQSGGRAFRAASEDVPDIAARIGLDLRNRYVLGFTPDAAQRDGRYHPVEVKIVPPAGLPRLRASWRRGYYAPLE